MGSLDLHNGGLNDDILLETCFCQLWSFQGRVQVVPGSSEQRPRSFLEIPGHPKEEGLFDY